ncbi:MULTISPECIES: [protein-PII] uridylyltransferase [unclassified Marinimicrobium]|jgi:[protein-PII] uridylyltransferase|uniref:[protein-PII] uridylyltransferase n=1 Tax=unclassified Marinimicrobium TaxID=2632100 RepID=UPI000C54903B|nr:MULTISPECIES: [protein-PII] uridylyltransferase [unclassified Marinimicrobium]MAN51997.1 [protein-PII] uridylyltransferase [Marinimicrobium sp.]
MDTAALPYFERPLFFFDQARFRRALAEQPVITVFKDAITAANRQFDARFREGEDIRALVHERALFVDCMLHYAWHRNRWPLGISLEAVGGYGRCELHPHSDIDLLVLTGNDNIRDRCQEQIEQLLTFLWDIGLEIGHSVRSLEECVGYARNDITVATNLMESRTLVGDSSLRIQLMQETAPDQLWPADDFFRAKWQEQIQRHQKYNDTEYNLEPNIKNAPGGLRDIQMIGWVAKRFFQVRTLKQLEGKGFFTEEEFSLLQSGEEFLWRVRYGLHLIAGRAEERLLFDHQRELAAMFGYKDNSESLAVEQFMHRYYRLVMSLRELNDVLLQFLHEVILQKGVNKNVTALNERFQLRDHYIEAAHIYVFEETPSALLEIFVLMAKHPEIQGVRASTIRLIRESRHLIDDDYRRNPTNTQLFLELFHHPKGLVEQLKRMSRYGILGLYLPEFGQVTGQMQHDLFHIYTVDAHTLKVMQNMCDFWAPDAKEEFPIAAHVIKRLPKPELLYIAGLYHDIAKGRGGDHSTLGAVDAEDFCQRHGLSPRETRLICWLVEQHLLMSAVAQKQDISDPDVIHDFALRVGDQQRLDYLYTLTVADINGTNKELWNTWRASLMRQLYMETKRALRRGLENNIDKHELIEETQQSALRKLERKGISADTAWQLWSDMGEEYFMRETALDIAWHSEAMIQHTDDTPLILIKKTTNRELEGATQIFVRSKGRKNVFAAVATALDQLNLNIQDARIYNSNSGYTVDTFFVLNQDGEPLGDDPKVLKRIQDALLDELRLVDDYSEVISRRTPRRLKHFTMPTRTSLSNDMISGYTVLEVISPDRPGLLACIGRVFLQFDILLQNAKIATLGERVEDVFFITDNEGEPLSDPALCEALQREICEQLDKRATKTSASVVNF